MEILQYQKIFTKILTKSGTIAVSKENYELKDNTKEYIKGLKVVKKSVS